MQEAERRADASLEPVAMCEYRSHALSAPLLVDTLLIGQSRWCSEGDLNSSMNAAPVTDERHKAEEDVAVSHSDQIFRKSVSLRCSECAHYLFCTACTLHVHVRVLYSLQLVFCEYFTYKLTSIAYHKMYECILCIINRPGTVNALVFWVELDEPRLPSAGLLGALHQAGHCQRLNESGHSPHAPTSERPLPQWNSQYQQEVHLLRSPLLMRANDLLTFHCTLSHNGLLSCDLQ